jgi:hypothetical protein
MGEIKYLNIIQRVRSPLQIRSKAKSQAWGYRPFRGPLFDHDSALLTFFEKWQGKPAHSSVVLRPDQTANEPGGPSP